ncbi:hypothetical protein [Algibacter lectus]|uniref:hypothetical protein n=1 Tax=Algibacter lectus TaxID=221126 RepID=UPI0024951EAC|nr:hypothetical protein [Algibacter lectus]
MNEIIKIDENVYLNTQGDISKISTDNFLFEDNFITYNNNYFKKGFDKKLKNINEIIEKLPGFQRIINSLEKSTSYKVVIPKEVLEKLQNGSANFIKSKSNNKLFTPLIREVGKKGIRHQVKLVESDFSSGQLEKLLSSSQMMVVQQSISSISKQIEVLDKKLNGISLGLQNDRLAYIQSGYNLFLQGNASKSLKKNLYSIALSQLNLGREQLIYSVKYNLQEIGNNSTGTKAMIDSIFSDENIKRNQEKKIIEIKQAILFIIRATQIMTIIYQYFNEKWSMLQSVIRLNDVFSEFTNEKKDLLLQWEKKGENRIQLTNLFINLDTIQNSINEEVKIILDKPKEVEFNLKIEKNE